MGISLVRRIACGTLCVAGFVLLAGLARDSFRQVEAQEVQINAKLGTGFVQITDGACGSGDPILQDAYDENHDTLDIRVMPNSIASNCLGINVQTDSALGYTLTISGPSDGNLTLAGQAISPKDGSLTAPTVFAMKTHGASWGFAVPETQIKGFVWGFDDDYEVEGQANSDNTAHYAPVPTAAIPLSRTDGVSNDDYDIFFAVAAGGNVPTGTYSGTVVISGVGNAAPMADCANAATGFSSGCTDGRIAMRLPAGMTPVIYTGSDAAPEWTVVASTDTSWYDYAQKEWANAITFGTAGNRNLAVGTKLSPTQNTAIYNDIVGYWVYVPRYEYRLINTGFDGVSNCSSINPQFCPQAFEIRFVHTNVARKAGTKTGDWHSHPAFQTDLNGDGDFFDANEQVSGIWVAKFMASAEGKVAGVVVNSNGELTAQGTATLDCTDDTITFGGDCNTSAPKATFLPNVPIWARANLANIFTNTQAVPAEQGITLGSTTGMTNGWNNYTWGAAMYLAQSLYGVCSNRFCTYDGTQNIKRNDTNQQKTYNNGYYNEGTIAATSRSRYLTGCGPVAAGSDGYNLTCNVWFGTIGKTASTTQNQTGIYDMAGGVWEYTFSAYGPNDDCILLGTTGLGNTGPWSSGQTIAKCPAGSTMTNSMDKGYFYNKFGGGVVYSLNQMGAPVENAAERASYGGLANNPLFFGSATSETVSFGSWVGAWDGGWNIDLVQTVGSVRSWIIRGGLSNMGFRAGASAFADGSGYSANGGINDHFASYRVVVSGF
ncbi:hypothetical protein FWG86_01795 [Candidatus Saccharibacteria bacterium]|nr:hypothetical protein [Candidatus Saccharibacteria bacterium]